METNLEQNDLIDSNIYTSKGFEALLRSLWKIPEEDWFNGRRGPVIQWIEKYYMRNPNKIETIRPEIFPYLYFTIQKIDLNGEIYIYYEEIHINPINNGIIIDCFQVEKQDISFEKNFYKTTLLLSSDNKAETKGEIFLNLYEQFKKAEK